MNTILDWRFWSVEQIISSLPDLLDEVEFELEKLSEEQRERTLSVIKSLKAQPPTADEINEGSRFEDLLTLGIALDALGLRAIGDVKTDEGLRLFRSAHELFRGGNPSLRPTGPMHQTLRYALKAIVIQGVNRITAEEAASMGAG